MSDSKILVIDDDEYVRLSVQLLLEDHFDTVKLINRPEAIPILLAEQTFDAVLLDMNFQKGETSGRQGLYWLEKILEADSHTSIVLITAYGEVDLAVNAMKLGAMDFVTKPWQNEKMLSTVNAACRLSRSKRQVEQLKGRQQVLQQTSERQFSGMVGNSEAMQKIHRAIEKVAGTDANVMITGENGTGKELVARALHRQSKRSKEIFVDVDLGAITESLFESELFGHVKGAFTDARDDRPGRFEAAAGGTLFLDEIANLSVPLQAKLLTALQSRKVFRVGSNRPIDVDVRLICATNADLESMVAEKQFREDLLYRINTVEIHLPPLRERVDDISPLVNYYLDRFRQKYAKNEVKLASAALRALEQYPWPGNVRELQHAVERAVIMSEGNELNIGDFAIRKTSSQGSIEAETFNLEKLEEWAIRNALKKHGGNITRAAEEVGLTRGAMYRRMEKHGL